MLHHNGTLLSSCFVPLISEKQISTGCYQQSGRQIVVAHRLQAALLSHCDFIPPGHTENLFGKYTIAKGLKGSAGG